MSDLPSSAPIPDTAFEKQLLEVAERAARAAGAELISRWGGPLKVQTKSTDTDPVSEADLAAERAIREILASERPDDAILGEEGGETGAGSELRWVVDPLDGTVNYLYGLPTFVVSVACEDERGGLAAVVYDPVRDLSYHATRSGEPACGDETLVSSDVSELRQALVATGFAYDPDVRAVQGRTVAGLLPLVRDVRRAGAAALDMCWCASGRVDAYYERGVKPWDIAAGTLICERAGLVVRRLETAPAQAVQAELPSGIVVAPPALIDELYELVS
jgi:myo-inositol-1(or 4)-monophosphatase